MSEVKYDGNRLIPAPLVNITKNYNKSPDGQLIGSTFAVSLRGTIVAYKGSPDSTGSFHTGSDYPADESISANSRLSAIQNKQDAIRNLFTTEGKPLIIKALDGVTSMSGHPRVVSIEFPEAIWYNRSEYTINLELDELYPEDEDSFAYNISSAQERWTVDTNEQAEGIGDLSRTYRLTHSVSATGKRRQDGSGNTVRQAWHEAENWVKSRLGFDSDIALSSGVKNLPAYYGGYNHIRDEQIGEMDGTYSVTETWTLTSGTALEDFTVTTTSAVENNQSNVVVAGNIIGLEERDSDLAITTTKYSNALSKFNVVSGLAYTRAQDYSGLTLNTKPVSSVFGKNPIAGTINYSFTYNDRPSYFVAGARSEVITVTDTPTGGASFAEIFVLERGEGPILQNLGTRPSFRRTLNIELVMDIDSAANFTEAYFTKNPRVDAATSGDLWYNIIHPTDPRVQLGVNACFSDPPQETWDFRRGRYSYNRTWTYVPSG